tara:strand:+ start:854 stop:1093 length:240 start_codon:yes stop_codon:yes gene_type:complete
MNGKGDKARPFAVSRETYEDRYDAIFGKKKAVEDTVKTPETLYTDSADPFAEWLKQCPVDFSEDYTDNHGTRAGYTFWI